VLPLALIPSNQLLQTASLSAISHALIVSNTGGRKETLVSRAALQDITQTPLILFVFAQENALDTGSKNKTDVTTLAQLTGSPPLPTLFLSVRDLVIAVMSLWRSKTNVLTHVLHFGLLSQKMILMFVRDHALDLTTGGKKARNVLAHAQLVILLPQQTQSLPVRSLALVDTPGEKKITLAIENAQLDGNPRLKILFKFVLNLVLMDTSWIMMKLAFLNVTGHMSNQLRMVSNTVSILVDPVGIYNGLVIACQLVVDLTARELGLVLDSVITLN
jgi:hypothetical protein